MPHFIHLSRPFFTIWNLFIFYDMHWYPYGVLGPTDKLFSSLWVWSLQQQLITLVIYNIYSNCHNSLPVSNLYKLIGHLYFTLVRQFLLCFSICIVSIRIIMILYFWDLFCICEIAAFVLLWACVFFNYIWAFVFWNCYNSTHFFFSNFELFVILHFFLYLSICTFVECCVYWRRIYIRNCLTFVFLDFCLFCVFLMWVATVFFFLFLFCK